MIIYDRKYNTYRCLIIQGKTARNYPCLKCNTLEQAKEFEKNLKQKLTIDYKTVKNDSI